MSLIAGSYERFVWGYKLKTRKHSDSVSLAPLFSFPSHLSAIKAVAAYGNAAVSGGNDDTIKIYDLSTSTEIGSLNHSSSITSLAFYAPPSVKSFPRNLLSADAEGMVTIYEVNPFVELKSVQVHKTDVNCLCVHPSGRLALTVGHDEFLAMIDLVRGRRSFYCRLSKEASIVQFNEDGEKFFMVVDEKVSVHNAEDAKLMQEFQSKKRVLCAASSSNGLLFTGGEDRSVTGWDTATGKVAFSIEDAHAARVKGIVVLSKSSGEENPHTLASASSDGVIRIWDVRMTDKGKPNPLTEANTRSRITCLAGSSVKLLKRPQLENISPALDTADPLNLLEDV